MRQDSQHTLFAKRRISLRPEQDEWLIEQAWQRRTTVSGLIQQLIDFYRQHEESTAPVPKSNA